MSGEDIDLDDLLGPEPVPATVEENLVDAAPPEATPLTPSQALLRRSRSYPTTYAAKKNKPELMKRALLYVSQIPVTADCARRLGKSPTTLNYWLQKSRDGAPGDGFDVDLGPNDENGTPDNTIRFHEAWDIAMTAGVENVEAITMRRATGYDETLTYQGRVQYKYDPAKLAESRELGLPEYVPENYLLDEWGAPVPETVYKMDPDLAMFILKARKPQVYGNRASLDVNVKGGVLVVGMQATSPEELNQIESDYRKNGQPSVVFDDREGED